MKPLYVAATGQHVGKTTSTLGLVSNILSQGKNVGYCKPVGQSHLTVDGQIIDKDVVLFSEMLDFKVDASIHSPVVMGKGVTKAYIDHPENFKFHEQIIASSKVLKERHEVVVYEGTGHPGVGSVADVSNAQVARILDAGVLMIAEGGIGNTIDRLTLSIAQFRHFNIPILGVIVNKVFPDKIDQVQYYVGKKLKQWNLDLIGTLPFDKRMSFPLMETVMSAIQGKILFNKLKLYNRIEHIVAGSLVNVKEISTYKNMMLVVSAKRLDEAIKKISSIAKIQKLESPLAGIIITGDGVHEEGLKITERAREYIIKHETPVITTTLDTFGAVVKVSRIEVKINTHTPWKTKRAIQLIRENVDVDLIIDKLSKL